MSLDDSAPDEPLRAFFDELANRPDHWARSGYRNLLLKNIRFYIPPGSRILEIGCGKGDLLARLDPSAGVGVDFSREMIRTARDRFDGANLKFIQQTAESLDLDEQPFDYVIISDTLSFLDDILALFRRLRPYCH